MSDDFFPALNQSHVLLETRRISCVTASIVVENGQEHKLDALVLATGFRTPEFLLSIKIFGLHGRLLEAIWASRPRAHLGVTVESLPNFAMPYRLNTNLGHNFIILMIETQSHYISSLIAPVLMPRSNGRIFWILPEVQFVKNYDAQLQARLRESAFAHPTCHSWYKNSEGVVTNNWAGTAVEYQTRLSQIDWNDYETVSATGELVVNRGVEHIVGVVEETRGSSFRLSSALGCEALVTLGAI